MPAQRPRPKRLCLQHRTRRPRTRYRIRVTMHELPVAVFAAKHARDPQGDRCDVFAPTYLRLEPLDFEDVSEVTGDALREVLELDRLAIPVVGCGSPAGLLDLIPTASGQPEGVRQGDVLTPGEQCEEGAGIPSRDLVQRSVAGFDCSLKVLLGSHPPTTSSGLDGAVLTIALRDLRKPRRLTRDESSSS